MQRYESFTLTPSPTYSFLVCDVWGCVLEQRADLLSRFMTLTNEEGMPYTDKHLRDVVVNFIIAGRDTTALTLSWLFSMLCKHPQVVHNILEEAKSVLADQVFQATTNGHSRDHESHSPDEIDFHNCDATQFAQLLTYQALNKMTYLHASITEALRLYPAVPLVRIFTSTYIPAACIFKHLLPPLPFCAFSRC